MISFWPNGNLASAWFNSPETYMVSCRATNVCGVGYFADLFVDAGRGDSSSNVNVYPNPVSDILYVVFNPPANLKAPPTYDIRLYDGVNSMPEMHQIIVEH